MFTQNNSLTNKIVSLSWRIFNKFENNGNAIFEENGEKFFIENLFKTLKARGGGR